MGDRFLDAREDVMHHNPRSSSHIEFSENFPRHEQVKPEDPNRGTANLSMHQAMTMHGGKHKVQFVPKSAEVLTSIFSAGGIFTIGIPASAKLVIDNIYLEFKIQNTNVSTAAVMLPVPWLFSEIKINGNDGSSEVQVIRSEEEWIYLNQIEPEVWKAKRKQVGMSNEYAADFSIAASTTSPKKRHLMLSSFFNQAQINMLGWKKGFEIEFRVRAAPLISGTAGDLRLVNPKIIVENFALDRAARNQLEADNSVKTERFLDIDLFERTVTFSANAANNIHINQLKGLSPAVIYGIRTATTGRALYEWLRVDSFELKDGNGQRIISEQAIEDQEHRFSDLSTEFRGKMHEAYPWYVYSPSASLKKAMDTASIVGGYTFKGDEQITFNTPAAGTNPVITATANTAPAATDYVQYAWTDPRTKERSVTVPLLANTAIATVATAIEDLPSYRDAAGTCTASGAVLSSGDTVFTFSGYYYSTVGGDELTAQSLEVIVNSAAVADVSVVLTTAGVIGFTATARDVVAIMLRHSEFMHHKGEIMMVAH